jgi:hypothetical protein
MEGMLQQLLAKDLLYAPMKELRDKVTPVSVWLAD